MSPERKKLLNVVVLGFGFMFMFTAFQTCGNIEQTVIVSLNSTEFHGSGYTSLAIIYGVFSASNIFAPSVVAVLGARLSLFISGLFYSAYIATFIQPFTWSFYTASVFIGIAAAVLWTAQGSCLTVNSNDSTIGRNSGIFWALLQCSLLFGNLFIYIIWHGEAHITDSDRRTVFISLTVISLVGAFLFFLIRNLELVEINCDCSDSDSRSLDINTVQQSVGSKALEAFKKSAKLSVSKEMLLLCISMAYTGLELTFFSGVYGTCIGAMKQFGNEAKSLIGLSGIFIGIGEILGGGLFGFLDKWNRYGRNPVVLLGLTVHFIAFYLIFFNIPGEAPIASADGTDKTAFMTPNKEVAMLCSFLLGFGDSCFNTQLISILGSLFSESSAPAFAIFKFVQSICAAVAFFYSNYLLLEWQLLFMVLFGFFGTISFFFVEWSAVTVSHGSDFNSIQQTN